VNLRRRRAVLGFGLGLFAAVLLAATNTVPARRIGPDDSLLAEGRFVFERNCVICHGKWGDGRGEMATGMVPRPRKFTAGTFKFRSTPSGSLPTDADLARTIRGGLFGTSMPTFQHLPERDVKSVIEYVKTFSRKWSAPENYATTLPLPEPPAWLNDVATRAPRLAAGRALFELNCQPCHGPEGRGNGPATAELEDEWGQPAVPADLTRPAIKSGTEPRDLYRVLVTGLNGTPMPSFLESTTESERWDLVAYLLSIRSTAVTP
jgi:cytochrome c oxidase cbb3-type subunit 2